MTPKECKRLAKVDFRIAVVSKHAGGVLVILKHRGLSLASFLERLA